MPELFAKPFGMAADREFCRISELAIADAFKKTIFAVIVFVSFVSRLIIRTPVTLFVSASYSNSATI